MSDALSALEGKGRRLSPQGGGANSTFQALRPDGPKAFFMMINKCYLGQAPKYRPLFCPYPSLRPPKYSPITAQFYLLAIIS